MPQKEEVYFFSFPSMNHRIGKALTVEMPYVNPLASALHAEWKLLAFFVRPLGCILGAAESCCQLRLALLFQEGGSIHQERM
jgi:hypothetical protein